MYRGWDDIVVMKVGLMILWWRLVLSSLQIELALQLQACLRSHDCNAEHQKCLGSLAKSFAQRQQLKLQQFGLEILFDRPGYTSICLCSIPVDDGWPQQWDWMQQQLLEQAKQQQQAAAADMEPGAGELLLDQPPATCKESRNRLDAKPSFVTQSG